LQHPRHFADEGERRYEINASFDELVRRGVDAESLVRHGLCDHFAVAIPMLASLPEAGVTVDGAYVEVAGPWHSLLLASFAFDRDRGLAQTLDLDTMMKRMRNVASSVDALSPLGTPSPPAASSKRGGGDPNLFMYAVSGQFVSRVINWVRTVDLNSLFEWEAPQAEPFVQEAVAVAPTRADAELGRWLFDRFSKTYLADWEQASLKREWRWLLGRCPGAATNTVMKERPTRAEEVSACLADVVSEPPTHEPALPAETPGSVALFRFVHLAATSLREGRRQEAIDLYRGLAQLRPEDPDINNNYGFCLLIDEPETALQWLERAAALREGMLDATNLANRVYALVTLGLPERALTLADGLFAAADMGEPFPTAYLWVDTEDGPVLREQVDPVGYTARLALAAAQKVGDSQSIEKWTARVAASQITRQIEAR
jgi:tetratricopeptide (TPR) repeat protein